MRDLSVIIPARNEMFAARTVESVLSAAEADTEVVLVLDGYWPNPPVVDHPKVAVVHVTEPIGQRAAVNLGARISQARYIMKLDAHCALDKGFDVKLMRDCQPDWTIVPLQYSLHAFDWRCESCGNATYQGIKPKECRKCGATLGFEMVVVWQPRRGAKTWCWRFDENMQFQYWSQYKSRPQATGELVETMSFMGACMFLERERFWALGGMDEAHGSWGQFGTEWACKSWLSGGKLICNKKTWFAHMFRTGNFKEEGKTTWPYPLSWQQIEDARRYSRDLWMNNAWPGAIYPLSWLLDKFAPVPGWHEDCTGETVSSATRPTKASIH